MTYEVIARKYRPRQFAEVVGQEHVTRTLANAIASGRVAHAYLFVGPRGIGKTTIARIFAKALNCVGGPRAEPCDRCESCLEIAGGRSLDVLEIDGASNNSVEQVRDLRENARYTPVRGPYKIYIIDEVHMLSISAFNALLKTLEEPPPHVKFIFATTEPQKVPATIASRCQRFDLRRIALNDIVRHLAFIAEREGVKISPDALIAIARGAEGGLRDAESALDQLISFRGREINEEDVLAVFGLVSRQTLDDLCGALLAGKATDVLRLIHELDRAGKDLARLTIEILEWLRNALVINTGEAAAKTLELTAEQIESLKKTATGAPPDRLLRMVEILIETDGRMRYALSRRTLLEMALYRCARTATTATLSEILQALHLLQARLAGVGGGPGVAASLPTTAAAPRVAEAPAHRDASGPAAIGPAAAPAATVTPPPAASSDDLERLRSCWGQVVAYAAAAQPQLKTHLKAAVPVSVGESEVRIAFPADAEESLRVCQEKLPHRAIENALRRHLGRVVRAIFERGIAAAPPATSAPSPKPAADAPPASNTDRTLNGSTESQIRERLIQDPTVRRALEMFDGSITDIQP